MNGPVFKGFDGKGQVLNLKMLAVFMPRDFKPILKDLLPTAQHKFAFSLVNPKLIEEISFWLEQSMVARLSGPTMDTMVTERDKLALASNPFSDFGIAKAEESIIDIEAQYLDDDEFTSEDDDDQKADLALADSANVTIVAMALGMSYNDFFDHMSEHDGKVEEMLNCSLSKVTAYPVFKQNIAIALVDAMTMLGVRFRRNKMGNDGECTDAEMRYGVKFAAQIFDLAGKEMIEQMKKVRKQ